MTRPGILFSVARLAGSFGAVARGLARKAELIRIRVSWSSSARARGDRALEIISKQDQIRKITPCRYAVRSQTDPSKEYDVRRNGSSWSCDCPDHTFRKAQCKHILSVLTDVACREEVAVGVTSEQDSGEVAARTPCLPAPIQLPCLPAPRQLPCLPAPPCKVTNGQTLNACEVSQAEAGRPKQDGSTVTEMHLVEEIPTSCYKCGDTHITRAGKRNNKPGPIQRWECKYGHKFVYRKGFEKMRTPAEYILDAIYLYMT